MQKQNIIIIFFFYKPFVSQVPVIGAFRCIPLQTCKCASGFCGGSCSLKLVFFVFALFFSKTLNKLVPFYCHMSYRVEVCL